MSGSIAHIEPSHEDVLLALVEAGEFQIKQDGSIWRVRVRGKKVTPRRAEYERSGYLRVRASVNGVRFRCSAHWLVYRYFKGRLDTTREVNHLDGDRQNNHPDNLEAVTRRQNERWKRKLARCS